MKDRYNQIITTLKNINLKEILRHKLFRRTVYSIITLILILFISYFCFRNIFLHHFIEKKIASFNKKYNAEFVIGSANFTGIAGLKVTDVYLMQEKKDTLLKFSKLSVHMSFWNLMFRKIKLKDFELEQFYMIFSSNDSSDNYSFLLKTEKDTNIKRTATVSNYSQIFNHVLTLVFDIIPSNVDITDFNIIFRNKKENLICHLDQLKIENKFFKSGIHISENDTITDMAFEGSLDKSKMQINAKLYSANSTSLMIPYVKNRYGLKFLYDTVLFSFNVDKLENNQVKFHTVASLAGLNINHPRISKQDVKIKNCSFFYRFNITPDYFELDSSSFINLNKLNFNPYLKYHPKPTAQVWFKIIKNSFDANELFESLPEGLFENLQGLKTKGNLSFHLDFYVDMNQIDSLLFESDLKKQDFKIVKFGNTDLSKMNGPFSYTAYENGEPVKTFGVDASNPDFRTIDQISSYLKDAVLLCEDNAFMWHQGFVPEAFRYAIIEDIKRKKFARGGSTITMQLVKNVFLNRNKTVARKLEEMLIVWLIENNHLTSKPRMFEVYLNVIEWGPFIYGANEASHFYFKKDVSQLTVSEAIFMASIIPRPKFYQYAFDSGQILKPYFTEHMQMVAGKMLKKEVISQEVFDRFIPEVKITGPAKSKLIKSDTINILQMEPED